MDCFRYARYTCIFWLALPTSLRAEYFPSAVPETTGVLRTSHDAVFSSTLSVQASWSDTNIVHGIVVMSRSMQSTTSRNVADIVRTSECKILAGSRGKLVQIFLVLCCCLTFFYKFHKDAKGRTFREFGLDCSKQLCGAGWIHVLNLFSAQRLERHFEMDGDECHWYLVNVVVDCTIGVGVLYLFSRCLKQYVAALCAGCEHSLESGQYYIGDTFSPRVYLTQLIFWLLIVTLMKISMLLLMLSCHQSMIQLSNIVLSPFQWDSTLTLLFVMIVTPFGMTALQFWIIDNFITKSIANREDTFEEGSTKTKIQHDDL